MQLGLYTFGDRVPDPHTGKTVSAPERMKQMLELAKTADALGLELVGVGEHHALRYVNSATATILSAMAAVTKRVRLTSASTSISTADPVRTFQEYAMADLVSEGRVELIFGRGAFTENFPLFGYELGDYDALFVEKVKLFAELNAHERVSWSGQFRPPLHDAEISPRPAQSKLPVWVGAGSPGSVVRAAQWGYPLALPMVGGSLPGYARIVSLYRQAWVESGRAPTDARVAAFSHFHVSEEKDDTFFRYYSAYLEPLFKGPMPRDAYAQMGSPMGALVRGDVQQVVDKLVSMQQALGLERYFAQLDIGGQPWPVVMRCLELYATKVAPAVRQAVT